MNIKQEKLIQNITRNRKGKIKEKRYKKLRYTECLLKKISNINFSNTTEDIGIHGA